MTNTNNIQNKIYTHVNYKQRRKVQQLLSIHCKKIIWEGGMKIKESDFYKIKRDIDFVYDLKSNSARLTYRFEKNKSTIENELYIKDTKTFLKMIKDNYDKIYSSKIEKRKNNKHKQQTNESRLKLF